MERQILANEMPERERVRAVLNLARDERPNHKLNHPRLTYRRRGRHAKAYRCSVRITVTVGAVNEILVSTQKSPCEGMTQAWHLFFRANERAIAHINLEWNNLSYRLRSLEIMPGKQVGRCFTKKLKTVYFDFPWQSELSEIMQKYSYVFFVVRGTCHLFLRGR